MYNGYMPTYIELHLVTYFTIFVLMFLSCKQILKTKATILKIFLAATIFCTIKFMLDYHYASTFAQIAVIFFYFLSSNLVVHKFSHVSKLIVSMLVCMGYYLVLLGLKVLLSQVLQIDKIFHLSNFYLLSILGLSMICYHLLFVIKEYLLDKNYVKLSKVLTVKIDDKNICLNGFVDTGNRLVDPKTNLGVAIVNLSAIKNQISQKIYADILFCTNSSGKLDCIHKIKYTTILGTSFITVFKPTEFVVSGKNFELMIGVSVSDKIDGYQAIMPAVCL